MFAAVRRRTTASSTTAREPCTKYAGVAGSADEAAGTGCRVPAGRSSRSPSGTRSPAIQSTAFSRVNQRAAHWRRSSAVSLPSPHSG